MRDAIARPVGMIIRMTGFRFSKDYRWGTTAMHRAVYAMVNTVRANLIADKLI